MGLVGLLALLHELLFAVAEVRQHSVSGCTCSVANPRIHVGALDDVFGNDVLPDAPGCLVGEDVGRGNADQFSSTATDAHHRPSRICEDFLFLVHG